MGLLFYAVGPLQKVLRRRITEKPYFMGISSILQPCKTCKIMSPSSCMMVYFYAFLYALVKRPALSRLAFSTFSVSLWT